MAEDAARDLPNLPLLDAVQLVRLYAERGSPKLEKAALHLVAVRIRLDNWGHIGDTRRQFIKQKPPIYGGFRSG